MQNIFKCALSMYWNSRWNTFHIAICISQFALFMPIKRHKCKIGFYVCIFKLLLVSVRCDAKCVRYRIGNQHAWKMFVWLIIFVIKRVWVHEVYVKKLLWQQLNVRHLFLSILPSRINLYAYLQYFSLYL